MTPPADPMPTSPGPARPRLPDAFPTFAFLFTPADPTVHVEVHEADARWRLPGTAADTDTVLWGRLAWNARPTIDLVPGAVAREATIARLRMSPPGGLRLAELHRLPAVRRAGRFRGPVRTAILSGALAELTRGERHARVIDDVVAAAGAGSLGARLRPSGDGSALATLSMPDGTPVELRVARLGHPKAQHRGYAALEALEAAGIRHVPRPVARGDTAGAGWSLETRLAGDHTSKLTPGLLGEVTHLLLQLPEERTAPWATDDHVAEVRRAFPQHADALDAACAAVRRWSAGMSSVLLHGDLWLNNVLVVDGRLSGIFDWDTWHPAGLPGADLLDLLASEDRTRSRRDFGTLLVNDHWRSPEVREVLGSYFAARGRVLPDAAGLAAIGVGWWASRVAAALDRGRRPTEQPAWVARNLVAPLDRIARLERELS